jgi:hypothetical protein
MAFNVQLGTDGIATFETLSYENGTRVNADTTPTVEFVHVNGVINSAIVPTITQMQDSTPANITGYYKLVFSTGTLSTQDDVHIAVSATIDGVVTKKVFHFLVINEPGTVPVIR